MSIKVIEFSGRQKIGKVGPKYLAWAKKGGARESYEVPMQVHVEMAESSTSEGEKKIVKLWMNLKNPKILMKKI